MSYNIEIDDIFDFKEKSYLTVDTAMYNNYKYLFVNELEDESSVKKFMVFKCLPEGIVVENNENTVKYLLEIFEKNINSKLQNEYEVSQ